MPLFWFHTESQRVDFVSIRKACYYWMQGLIFRSCLIVVCFGFCYTECGQELSLKKGIQCLSQLCEKVKLDFPVSVRTAARSDFTVFDFVGCFTNRATENSWVSSEKRPANC